MRTSGHKRIIRVPNRIIYQSHDVYGKDSLKYEEIIIDCLKSRLSPNLIQRIDFPTLKFMHTDLIRSGDLLNYRSDVIYKVSIDNKAGIIYFIIELQSTPDRHMAQRLDEYKALLSVNHQTMQRTLMRPFILPTCMYNGRVPYPYSTRLCDCIEYPELAREYGTLDGFELWDLTQSTIDELLQQGGKSGFFQALLKQGRRGEFIEVLQKVTPEYIQQLPRGHIHSSAMYIYHNSKPEQGEECLRLLSQLIQEKSVKEKVMSYADSIHYKGIAAGKQLGIKEGVIKGKQLGKQLGKQEGMLEAAKNLLHQGVEMGIISLATGLQREQLLQLK